MALLKMFIGGLIVYHGCSVLFANAIRLYYWYEDPNTMEAEHKRRIEWLEQNKDKPVIELKEGENYF